MVTSTLDRTWNDLPTRSDFVPFLYEAVFHVASARSHRNVLFAEPLLVRLPAAPTADGATGGALKSAEPIPAVDTDSQPDVFCLSPDNAVKPARVTEGPPASAVFSDTFAPGIYRITANVADRPVEDVFVVNYDHSEDELAQLTPDDKARLATKDRVRFSSSLDELKQRMYGDESITELWAMLMIFFLLSLFAELLLTRRTLRKGYGGESLSAA